MKKLWVALFMAILLVGCRPKSEEEINLPAPTVAALSGQPVPVALSELAANPAVYEGAYIQLTGRYKRRPLLICKSKAQSSPATWGVSSDDLLALAGGFDGQLRPLLPENSTMIVAGRWQHWRGAVGCGDTAQLQDVWYLAVSNIISPNPIAQVTLTPEGVVDSEGAVTAVAPMPPDDLPGEGRGTAVPLPSLPPAQSTSQPADPVTTVTIAATATPSFAMTGTPSVPTASPQSITSTPLINGTGTATLPTATTQTTPTPHNTPLPGTTATSTPTLPPNITPTSTPDFNGIDRGNIDAEDLFMDEIPSVDRHLWTFENEIANNRLSVNAVSVSSVDIAVTIIDPNGNVLLSQNNAAEGQVEEITAVPLSKLGVYQIMINSANNVSGGYGLMMFDRLSLPNTFGIISYNHTTTTDFDENSSQYWFFMGNKDDVIMITAVPDNNADIGFELFGTNAESLEDIDEFGDGETEELDNYSLPASGLYALWLGGEANGLITVDLTVTEK